MSTQGNWCSPAAAADPAAPYSGNLAWEALSNTLCSTGWSAYLLTGMFVDFLVRHFAEPLSLEHPDLRNLHWTQDERTGILIEEESRWRGPLVEMRPAVIVKRNAYRSIRLVRKDLTGQNQRTGARDFAKLWSGSHTLFCLHRNGPGAEILATEVKNEVGQFAQVLQEDLGIHYLDVAEVGASSEVEESTESRAVPVTVGWCFEETWRLTPEVPPVRMVSLKRLCGCC